MTAIYFYREPAEDGVIPDPIQLDADRVRLYTLDVTQNAEEGSVATSTILIDDPDGDLDIVGHRIIAVKEDTITGDDKFVYVGYAAERKIIRGPYRTLVGRQWEVTVVDINTVLERRVMTGSDCNRPAETDVQRVQWLEATNEGHLISDTRYLSTANPVSMDAVDYRGQMFKGILDDCAQQSGKDYWVTYFGDGASAKYPWGTFGLWYGFRNRSDYASTIRLTNDLADVDSVTTFALSQEVTELRRDPSRVYSGVYMPYDGGTTYVQDSGIALAFARRDAISPAENVKTNARATARATRYLADIDTEEDIIKFGFQVPAAQVNDLRQGMLVPIKATHLPGYEDYVSMRVINRNVKQDSELTYFITGEAGRGGDPVVEGDVLIAVITVTQTSVGSVPADLSTNPWIKAFWSGDFASASQFPGPGGPAAWGIWYRAVVPGEDATVLAFDAVNPGSNAAWVYQVSGATVAGATDTNANDTLTYSTNVASTYNSPSAGADSVWIGGFGLQKVSYGQVTLITTTQGTELINANSANVGGGTCAVTPDGNPPRMWVGYRTGTGVLTVGGTVGCSGAIPDYNLFGRARGGLLLPLTGAFGVSQSAYSGTVVVGELQVTLSSPP